MKDDACKTLVRQSLFGFAYASTFLKDSDTVS